MTLKPVDARFLVWLYPGRWRKEYGEEMRAMLLSKPVSTADILDVVLHAARENIRHPDPTTAGFLFMWAWRGIWILCNRVSPLGAMANRADPWVFYFAIAVVAFWSARRERSLWRGYSDAFWAVVFVGHTTAEVGYVILIAVGLLPLLPLPPTVFELRGWAALALAQSIALGGGLAGRYLKRKTA